MEPKAAACQHTNCNTLTMKVFCKKHVKTQDVPATASLKMSGAFPPKINLTFTTEAEIKTFAETLAHDD